MQVCAGCNGTFSATGSFEGKRTYLGVPGSPGWGHFTVWAATRRLIREGFVGCTDGRNLFSSSSNHLKLSWIYCPPGSELDSGHVLVEWARGRWIYALSLHSNTPVNRRLLQAMAGRVVWVRR